MDNVVTTIQIGVHDAILSPMDTLVIPRVKLAIWSVNSSSTRNPNSIVLDPDQKDSSGKSDGLQKTASIRYDSNSKLDGIDETLTGKHSERNFDRQTHTHHRKDCFGSAVFKFIIYLTTVFSEIDCRLKNTARAD